MGLQSVSTLWREAVRKARIAGWKWARAELPYTLGVTSEAMAEVVLTLAQLERPVR